MSTLDTENPALTSKRPTKNEERVYLDDELTDFLSELQREKGSQFRSQALRYCIQRERMRDHRRPIEAAYRQRQRSKAGDRQPTGTRLTDRRLAPLVGP